MESKILNLVGKVVGILPGTRFLVELPNGHKVSGYLSGKMKVNLINIALDDKVEVEINTGNLSEARIIRRMREFKQNSLVVNNNKNKKR